MAKTQLWKYQGVDSATGQSVSGKVQALSEEDAMDAVTSAGAVPISVKRSTHMLSFLTKEFNRKPRKRDVAMFIRGYSTAASSQMRTEDALRIAAAGVRSKSLKRTAKAISDMYANGTPLHESFGAHSDVFGAETAAVMEAGEASGQVHLTLSALADAKERSGRIRGKVITALIYPSVVLAAAIGALAVIILVVLPKVQDVVSELETSLPALTQVLVTVSDMLKANAFITMLLASISALGLYLGLNTSVGKILQSYTAMYIPLFGPVVRGMNTAMLCELCGVMLSAGVTQVRIMELLSVSIRNHVVASELKQIPGRLVSGIDLQTACKMSVPKIDPVIPALAQQTAAGLSDPGEPWRRYGSAVAQEADRRADTLKSAIEPIMIIIVGILIGLMAAAVYMPMLKVYDFMNTIQG